MSLVSDDYLKLRDLNKYKKSKIKLVVNNRKGYIVISIYYIL